MKAKHLLSNKETIKAIEIEMIRAIHLLLDTIIASHGVYNIEVFDFDFYIQSSCIQMTKVNHEVSTLINFR